MAGEFEWDSRAFLRGLEGQLTKIKRGDRNEEERLARLVVDGADPPVLTGKLKASGRANGEEFGWSEPYAGHVEYGTEDTPAQPFGRPSIQRASRQLKSPI